MASTALPLITTLPEYVLLLIIRGWHLAILPVREQVDVGAVAVTAQRLQIKGMSGILGGVEDGEPYLSIMVHVLDIYASHLPCCTCWRRRPTTYLVHHCSLYQ